MVKSVIKMNTKFLEKYDANIHCCGTYIVWYMKSTKLYTLPCSEDVNGNGSSDVLTKGISEMVDLLLRDANTGQDSTNSNIKTK